MKFKVGEICECSAILGPRIGWAECEIIGDQGPYISSDGTIHQYLIHRTGYDRIEVTDESHLRRKQPPQEDNQAFGSWEKMLNSLAVKEMER